MSAVTNSTTDGIGDQLLDKIQEFVATLSDDERTMFATLIAPGVAAAWENDDEVSGFSAVPASDSAAGDGTAWQPSSLGDHLAAAVRKRHLTIVTDSAPDHL